MSSLFAGLDGCGAEISDDELYRYALTRKWSSGPQVAWLCFNPSVADGSIDDPSVRKMVGFSKRWGFGRMVLVNLFAFRSTDPKAVATMGTQAIGPFNDAWIVESVEDSKELICAWGCAQHERTTMQRAKDVILHYRSSHG